mgnify:CR=1 FL=1
MTHSKIEVGENICPTIFHVRILVSYSNMCFTCTHSIRFILMVDWYASECKAIVYVTCVCMLHVCVCYMCVYVTCVCMLHVSFRLFRYHMSISQENRQSENWNYIIYIVSSQTICGNIELHCLGFNCILSENTCFICYIIPNLWIKKTVIV